MRIWPKSNGSRIEGSGRTLRARNSGFLWAPVRRSTGTISKSRPFSLSTVATRTTFWATAASRTASAAPWLLFLFRWGRPAGQGRAGQGNSREGSRTRPHCDEWLDGWLDGWGKKEGPRASVVRMAPTSLSSTGVGADAMFPQPPQSQCEFNHRRCASWGGAGRKLPACVNLMAHRGVGTRCCAHEWRKELGRGRWADAGYSMTSPAAQR